MGRGGEETLRRAVEKEVEASGLPGSRGECTALVTRVLRRLGLQAAEPGHAGETAEGDHALAALVEMLKNGRPGLAEMLPLWRSRRRDPAGSDSGPYILLAERLVKMGENLMAYDVASEGLRLCGGHKRLLQLKALSLARSGATESALEIFLRLEEDGYADSETLGMLGRLHKDLWERDRAQGDPRGYLQLSLEYYRRAYALPERDYWPGINAATMALAAGRAEESKRLAGQVGEQCLLALKRAGESERYWLTATLGESLLLRGNLEAAARRYGEAVGIAGRNYGDIASTRRNAQMILELLECSKEEAEAVLERLRTARIAIFSGHMVDSPSRSEPRFPPEIEEQVRARLKEELESAGVDIGFASAACGADIIFHEVLGELGGESHVVLPYGREEFLATSVGRPGSAWARRFESVLEGAKQVNQASLHRLEDDGLSHEYANMVLLGQAMNAAEMLSADLVAVAVWDGREGDGPGGTGSNVSRWRSMGLDVRVVDTTEMVGDGEGTDGQPTAPPARGGHDGAEIRAILFADMAGYSDLSESETMLFVRGFMRRVGDLAGGSSLAPLVSNTWGDGLFMVFPSVRNAGLFALELADLVEETSWSAMGLSREMNIRIGLHAGPVHRCVDPVTARPNYYGVHVGFAARLEPITAPGHVYASAQFAALASCLEVSEIRCDYVGQVPFSKGFGTFPTYHVRRALSS